MRIPLKLHVMFMAVLLATATTASAQEVVRKEAPPEIRTMFAALVAGANGDAAAWESFAQAHYTEALLKKETPAQRAELQKKIADRFGTIAVNGVRREGPDGPLQVMAKGSKADGTILVDLDFNSPKIFAISIP
jgi:hypothetical protein